MVTRIKNGIVFTDAVPTDIATFIEGNMAPLNVVRTTVDGSGNAIALINSRGLVGTYSTATAINKTLTADDLETIIDCTDTVTITIPTDAVLGLTTPVTNWLSVGFFQRSAVTPVIDVSGVTLLGDAPTVSQYGTFGIVRIGVDTWAYV